MKKQVNTITVSLLMLLFIYAPVSKLLAPEDFRGQLHNQPFPHSLANVLFYALPAIELIAALALLTARLRLPALWLCTALMTLFTAYIGLALGGYWHRLPCSCGGILNGLPWTAHLVFNLVYLAICVTALITYAPAEQKLPHYLEAM